MNYKTDLAICRSKWIKVESLGGFSPADFLQEK